MSVEFVAETVRLIVGYTPRKVQPSHWSTIEVFTKGIAAQAAVQLSCPATDLLTYLSQYVDWAHRVVCVDLDARLILDPRLIARFCQPSVSGWSPRTCANARSILVAVAETVVGERPDLESSSRAVNILRTPYTPEQEASMRVWGWGQTNSERRYNATVLLALGLGAGGSPGEIDSLFTDDIDVEGDDVYVNFGDWVHRPRRVQVRPDWAAAVASAKFRTGPGLNIFRPQRADTGVRTRNSVSTFVERCTRIRPRVRAERLRLTWIVRRVEAGDSPLTVLEQSGLENFDRIRRIVSAAPTLDLSEFHGRYLAELAERGER